MIAVDTNVLIYACDQADAKRQKVALDLITNAQDGVLLWQVGCEFISASRKLHKQGFTSTHAWNRLAEFRDLPLTDRKGGGATLGVGWVRTEGGDRASDRSQRTADPRQS